MEKLRRYNLIQGECIEEMKKLKDKSIDLILCDLPYGTTDCFEIAKDRIERAYREE